MDKKEVMIDLIINDEQYKGTATVDLTTGEVESELFIDNSVWAVSDYGTIARVNSLIKWEALYQVGDLDIGKCEITGYHVLDDDLVKLYDGKLCTTKLADDFRGEYYLKSDFEWNNFRDSYGDREEIYAPRQFWEDYYYCDECNSYVENDDFWDDRCRWCNEEENSVIEDYGESHRHEPILFGEYKDEESFVGLGFELEVDCNSSQQKYNNDVAKGLCEHCGLEEYEMRFAYDGSLSYGFECISQPHTVKDFWDKSKKWRTMLSYLANHHYSSHDAGTCGLHIHVSRGMFGKTETKQETAIAKVYAFFDKNWDDIVKISRRKTFSYCDKNRLSDYEKYGPNAKTLVDKWKLRNKEYKGDHYVALNNRNKATFEYRLGRGTLNAWSFFSWIDFILTITKNAKRVTINKIESNDLLSWLGGIKESTAKYIYKRGAFRSEMVELFPNIEWESDLTDTNE